MWILKALLFALLVPGVLFRLYPSGSTVEQTLVHGLVFLMIIHVLYRCEQFTNPDTRVNPPCPKGYVSDDNGDCKAIAGAKLRV
jgi:hypothetical protein